MWFTGLQYFIIRLVLPLSGCFIKHKIYWEARNAFIYTRTSYYFVSRVLIAVSTFKKNLFSLSEKFCLLCNMFVVGLIRVFYKLWINMISRFTLFLHVFRKEIILFWIVVGPFRYQKLSNLMYCKNLLCLTKQKSIQTISPFDTFRALFGPIGSGMFIFIALYFWNIGPATTFEACCNVAACKKWSYVNVVLFMQCRILYTPQRINI